jgi:hypothetical protein
MCADGPADVLDFDDEEFIGAFSIHNRIMYRRRKTNNLLRAWIIFQEHVINNDVVRYAVQNYGYERWRLPNSAFRFRLPWNCTFELPASTFGYED